MINEARTGKAVMMNENRIAEAMINEAGRNKGVVVKRSCRGQEAKTKY